VSPAPPRRPRGKTRLAAPSHRDSDASSFSPILLDFIARVPGAIGAVLVDRDGEAVDYAGRVDSYDLKLAGAHWQIILREMVTMISRFDLGAARALAVRGERRSFIAHALPDDYVLLLLLGKRAGAQEAGWHASAASATWFVAQVLEGRAGRPARILANGQEHPLELLGRITGLGRSETGWRVRLEHGAELMLVREPGGLWYADEHIGDPLAKHLLPPT
jgi:predicted regulator of Ras-like GTPase activity (Roadblock/LC7/MglB family)